MRTALKWTAGVLLTLLVALALFIAFGLHLLRGPISRAVTQATGRELVIDGDLRAVWSRFHPRFRVEKVSFANSDWAREDYLFRADAVEAELRLLPLLRGRWKYVPSGILDATHLRFFVRDTAHDLLTCSGLVVDQVQPVSMVPWDLHKVIGWNRNQRLQSAVTRFFPHPFTYQYLMRARRRADDLQRATVAAAARTRDH